MSTLALPASSLRKDATVIGLVGLGHSISHFSQLLLAPLFPWLKEAFDATYTELGFLMTIFFVVSCAVQTASGFVVDRLGPRPVLFAGLGLVGLAGLGFSLSTGYWMMAFFAVVAGLGNGVFHPVDYTLLNRKVSAPRLGHAYSVHGITGSLGWALAPAMLVPLTMAFSWRVALACAGGLAFAVLGLLWLNRHKLALELVVHETPSAPAPNKAHVAGNFDFLRIPAVWMCFGFFFLYAITLSVVQAFAPEAARQLHGTPVNLLAACLTSYMLASAFGMIGGGFLVADPERAERVVGAGFALAACITLALAFAPIPALWVPVLFGAMGLVTGTAGPSRDMLVKRSTPPNSTGRVYGVVYSGLDIGQAISPLFFGVLMDHGAFQNVLLGLACIQGVLIVSALNVRRVRRTA
jgi:MFS family permease